MRPLAILFVFLFLAVAVAEEQEPPSNPFAKFVRDDAPIPQEVAALWEIVNRRPEGQAIRLLDDALRDAATSFRLRARAPFALHAVIGLDRQRRDRVERLLVERLSAPALTPAHRVHLAVLLSHLGDLSPEAARAVTETLLRDLATADPAAWLRPHAEAILRVRPALPEAEGRRACADAARSLLATLPKIERCQTFTYRLGDALPLLPHARQDRAALRRTAAAHLVQAFPRWGDDHAQVDLQRVAFSLLPDLDEPDTPVLARAVRETVLTAVKRQPEGQVSLYLLADLARGTSRLPAAEVARLGEELCPRVLAVLRTKEPIAPHLRRGIPFGDEFDRTFNLARNCRNLGDLTARWSPRDVERIAEEAGRQLVEAALSCPTRRTSDAGVEAIRSLAGFLARLPDDPARTIRERAIARIEQGFRASQDVERLAAIGLYLGTLHAAHPTAAGLRACREAGHDLQKRFRAATEVIVRNQRLNELETTGYRLHPVLGTALHRLHQFSEERRSSQKARDLLYPLAPALAVLAEALPATEAVPLLLGALEHLDRPGSELEWYTRLKEVLFSKLDRLDEGQAQEAVAALHRLLLRWGPGPQTRWMIARLAPRLTPQQVAALVARFQQDSGGFSPAFRLVTLGPCLSSEEAATLAIPTARQLVAHIVSPPGDADPLRLTGLDANRTNEVVLLADLAELLPPEVASDLCGAVLRHLLDSPPSGGFSEYSEQIPPRERLLAHVRGAEADRLRERVCRLNLATHRPDHVGPPSLGGRRLLESLYPTFQKHGWHQAIGLLALTDPRVMPAVLLVPPGVEPPSAQLCVDLLKHPLCAGSDRRAILDVLEGRYGRRFVDQWDFGRFASERNLGLDLTSPPKPDAPMKAIDR